MNKSQARNIDDYVMASMSDMVRLSPLKPISRQKLNPILNMSVNFNKTTAARKQI